MLARLVSDGFGRHIILLSGFFRQVRICEVCVAAKGNRKTHRSQRQSQNVGECGSYATMFHLYHHAMCVVYKAQDIIMPIFCYYENTVRRKGIMFGDRSYCIVCVERNN